MRTFEGRRVDEPVAARAAARPLAAAGRRPRRARRRAAAAGARARVRRTHLAAPPRRARRAARRRVDSGRLARRARRRRRPPARAAGRSIAPGLTGERRAVLEGIVLGDGAALSPGLRQDFQASGLYHLLAVCGQNVVLVAARRADARLAARCEPLDRRARRARRDRRLRARGRPAAVGDPGRDRRRARLARVADRAAARRLVRAAARGDRAARLESVLVYDPGFQLSFAAVAAIFTVVPRIAGGSSGRRSRAACAWVSRSRPAAALVTAPIVWLAVRLPAARSACRRTRSPSRRCRSCSVSRSSPRVSTRSPRAPRRSSPG